MRIKLFLYILCLVVPWQIPVYLWIYKKKPKNMKKRSFYFLIKAIYFLTPLSALIILDVNNWYTAIVSTFSKKEFFLKINAYILSGELLIAFLALIFTLYSYFHSSSAQQKSNEINSFNIILTLISENIEEISRAVSVSYINSMIRELRSKNTLDNHRITVFRKILESNRCSLLFTISSFKYSNSDVKKRAYKKLASVLYSNKRQDHIKLLYYILITKHVELIPEPNWKQLTRKYLFSISEKNVLEEKDIFKKISTLYNNKIINRYTLDYGDARDIFNTHQNGDQDLNYVFRLVHRAVKLINTSNLPEKEKSNLLGIIRAIIPDYAIIHLYYNCTYCARGIGLGIQLAGTSFFGNERDLVTKNGDFIFAQHFATEMLIFKQQDYRIMKNIYANPKIVPGTLSPEEFRNRIAEQFNKQNSGFFKSFKADELDK